MPITDDTYVSDINYSWYAPSLPQGEEPSLFGAAFRQENDIYNLLDYYSRPQFEADPNFDYRESARKSQGFLLNPEAFIGVQSAAEWQYREVRLAKERADRMKIAGSGAGGIFAAIVAGTLSPTILIPVGGQIKAAGSAVKAGAETAVMVALGATIQEGILHLNQDELTMQESLIGIGTAAALGAVLGAGVQMATTAEIKRITADMADIHRKGAISPYTAPSAVGLSADATSLENLAGSLPFIDPEGVARTAIPISEFVRKLHLPDSFSNILAMNWFGPVTRGLASKNAVRRGVTAQFSNAGIYSEAAMKGIAVAEGGTIEQLVKQHAAGFAMANKELQTLFKDWFVDTGKGSKFRTYFPTGSYKDFLEKTGDTMFEHIQGIRRAEIPEQLHKAADIILDRVYRAELKTAQEAGLQNWVQLADDTYRLQIATQQIRRDLVNQDYDAAKQIMREHIQQVLMNKTDSKKLGEDMVAIVGRKGSEEELSVEQLGNLADQIADVLFPKLLGEHGRSGTVDVLHEIGEKAAKFIYIDPTKTWSNGLTWGQFLERDVEKLSRSFVRSIAPDVELYRKFKTTRPDIKDSKIKFWDAFAKEQEHARTVAASLPEKEKKAALLAIAQEGQDFQRDLAVLVGRLRHTWGLPGDPTSFGHRAARMALQLNTMRLMGGVVIASFADLARIVMRVGFTNTFKHGVIPLLRDFQRFKLTSRELTYAGTALDLLQHGRSGMMFDLFDEVQHGNMLERAMQFGTSRVGIVALFDYWNVAMKQFSGAIWMGVLSDAIEATERGVATGWQKKMLAYANIDEDVAKRMGALIKTGDNGAEIHPGVWLPNTESWSEVTDEEIAAATKREFSRVKAEMSKPGKKTYPPAATAEQLSALKDAALTTALNYNLAVARRQHVAIIKLLEKGKSVKEIVDTLPLARTEKDLVTLAGEAAMKKDRIAIVEAVEKKLKEFRAAEPKKTPIGTFAEEQAKESKAFKTAQNRAFDRLHRERRELQRTYRAALAQLVDTTIVTPGIERPNWVDGSTPGRLIAQFRSFTLSSTLQVGRLMMQDARAGNMAPVALGSAFSLALGAFSYYIWALSVGGRTRERMENELEAALNGDSKALARWADEAFNRSGLMGVLQEVQKFGERVPGLAPYVTFAGQAPSRSPYVSPVFDAFGPTGNIIDNLDNIVMTFDDPTSSTFRSAKQLMPYQNLMFIRQYFDKLNDAMMDLAGVSHE